MNANTASKSLLTYVSGLSKNVAESFVQYRNKVGQFKSREDLLKVPNLGPKTYEQAGRILKNSRIQLKY